MIDFKVNGNNLKQNDGITKITPCQGMPVESRIMTELDQATIVFYSDKFQTINKYDNVDIYVYKEDGTTLFKEYNFLLMEYSYSQVKDKYKYTLLLIEPTKMLENIIIDGMAITAQSGLGRSVGNQMILAISKINKQMQLVCSSAPTLQLTNTVTGSTVQEYDFIWKEQMTAREILDDIASVLEKEIRASYDRTNNKLLISYDSPNTRGTLIVLPTSHNGYENSENAQYGVSGVRAFGLNTVGGTLQDEDYQVLRSESYLANTDNDCLITTFKIREPKQLLFKGNLSVSYYYAVYNESGEYVNTLSTTDQFTNYEMDLINYLVKKRVFDISSNEEKWKLLYYTENGNNVYNWLTNNQISSLESKTTINLILNDYFENHVDLLSKGHINTNSINVTFSGTKQKLIYIPVFDSLIDECKNNGFSRMLVNQDVSPIDAKKYAKNLSQKVKRLGNREINLDLTCNYNTSMYSLGDYTSDNYIIDSISVGFWDTHYKVRYHLTKDYTFNSFIKVNTELKIGSIPLDNYVNRYILINGGNITASAIANRIDQYRMLAVRTDAMDDNVWGVLFGAYYETDTALYFLYKTLDNYSLGKYRSFIDSTAIANDLTYVDNKGECSDITLKTFKYASSYDTANLCKINTSDFDSSFNESFSFTRELTSMNKDSYEMLTFVIKFTKI